MLHPPAMTYTVLGASGFIGRHLTEALRRNGHQVYAPARSDPVVFDRPLGHTIYCVGMTADFRSRPFDTARAHVSFLADVLEHSDFDSLLYLSSTRVYAHSVSGRETERIVTDVSDPGDLYNVTKLAGESLCRACGRANVRVARLANVIGFDRASENFLFALIREALSGRIELQTDPASAKDHILIDDVVALLPRIAAEGRQWLYNVASGTNLSNGEIAQRLAAATGCRLDARPGAPLIRFPMIANERIREEFDFSPTSVLDALPRLVGEFEARRNH